MFATTRSITRSATNICLMLIAALGLSSSLVRVAIADTVYFPNGIGKTYQNNYASQCVWYDLRGGSGAPCYKGVWSDTQLYVGIYSARVWERAWRHANNRGPNDICVAYYASMSPDPLDLSAQGYVSTGGTHYFPGEYGVYPVNVVGYAWHSDATVAPDSWYYTESWMYY